MKTFASLIRAQRDKMVLQAQESFSRSSYEAQPQLPNTITSEIFAGIFFSIEKDLESKQIDVNPGHHLLQFCISNFGKKLPFRFNLHEQQFILITARSVLDNWLLEAFGQHRKDFQHKSNVIRQILDNTFIKLSQQWDSAIQKLNNDDQTLIEELKIVKNGIQKQLNAIYQIIKESPIGVIGCDKGFNVRLWNPTATRLTGFQQADILKKNLLQIFTFESRNELIDKIYYHTKGNIRLRLYIQCKDGSFFPALITVSKIEYNQPNGIYYLINFLDLRGEKIIESQVRQINQLTAIARLSSAIMHDIRNPVNSIGLNVDLIEQVLEHNGSIKTDVREMLDKIHRQITNLTYILNQYLGYSRLAELKPEPIILSSMLKDLILDMRVENATRNIQIIYHQPKNDLMIKGDWIQLRRAFVNLIHNAIQAMQDNGTIWVKIYKRKNRILVKIQDSGPGIQTEQIKKIFEPFYSTKKFGAGLGLFIVKEIVQAHHGRITCKSELGQGTQFTISFRLYHAT